MTQEAVGRRTLAVVLISAAAAALSYAFIESFQRPSLGIDAKDTPLLLQWVDMAAIVVAALAGVQLLSPELCCDPGNAKAAKRERACVGLMLLFVVFCFSISSRIRNVNMNTFHDESKVCGRRDTALACPTQRINTSTDYTLWLRDNAPTCWLNTSQDNTFTWDETFASASFLNTNDFSKKQTYIDFPQFAECYHFGCSELCNGDQRHYNDRMLHFEVLSTFVFVVILGALLCVRQPKKQQVWTRSEWV